MKENTPVCAVSAVCTEIERISQDQSFKGKIKRLIGLDDVYYFETSTGEQLMWNYFPLPVDLSEIKVGTKGVLTYTDREFISFEVE